MAFLASQNENHYFHLNRYIGGNDGLAEHIYITTDDIDTVTAAGYFANWRGPLPRSGDVLRILEVVDRDDLSSVVNVHSYAVIEWNVSYVQADATGWRRNANGSFSLVASNGFEVFRVYADGDGARFEQATFGDEDATSAISNPFGIGTNFAVGRPKWRAGTGLLIYEGSDPGEHVFYHKANEPYESPNEAVMGSEATKFGQQGFTAWKPWVSDETDGSSADLSGEYKAVRPVVVTGAPNFAGDRWFQTSGVSGPVDGETVHVYSASSSGTAPDLSLSGETAKPLLRANGDVPSANYWTGPWEGTFHFDAGEDGWLADAESGTDSGGAGRTVDMRNTTPFYFRQGMVSMHYPSKPTSVSTAGMLTFAVTPNFEVAPRYRMGIGPGPGVVMYGRSGHEDYEDAQGYNGNDRYPGSLDLDGSLEGNDPEVNGNDKTSATAWGAITPKTCPPFANLVLTSSDIGVMPALAIHNAADLREGIQVTYNRNDDKTTFRAVMEGSSAITIASTNNVTDNGLGQFRLTYTAHGLKDQDVVYATGFTAIAAGVYVVRKVNDDIFDLENTRSNLNPGEHPGGSVGTITAVLRTAALSITKAGVVIAESGQLKFPATANPSSDANTLDDYQEGTWVPAYTFGTTEPSDLTYGSRAGKYTVIGNRCLFDLRITLTSKGTGGAGSARISLPVAVAAGENVALQIMASVLNGTVTSYASLAVASQSYAQIYEQIDNASFNNLTWSELTNTTTIWLAGNYKI